MFAIRRAKGWLLSWWWRVPEPRLISIITTLLYATIMASGVAILLGARAFWVAGDLRPPVGYVIICGALVGMIGGALDFWQLERVGIAAMSFGLCMFAVMGTSAGDSTWLAISAMFGLALRFVLIWRYQWKPQVNRTGGAGEPQ